MPDSPVPRLSPNHTEMLVLSVLAEGPSYGYAITKAINLRSEGLFAMGPAKLYPLLARLEKQHLVTTTWEEVKAKDSGDDTNGRRRKWYTLSPKGERKLKQHVHAHRRFTELIEAFIPVIEEPRGTPA